MRLVTRREYQRFTHHSKRYVGQWIIVELRQGNSSLPKLGITVTRRYGEAHERNRFKRIVREAFRLSSHNFPPGLEIHIKPRSIAIRAKMGDIRSELLHIVEKHLSM